MGFSYRNDQERITRNVQVTESGCWLWQLRTDHRGYGLVHVGGLTRVAHRLSYEAHVGPIPDGLQLDHLCRVRPCVNPQHLEPVTGRENIHRSPIAPAGINATKTECFRGHPFDEANTVRRPDGSRLCRECRRAANQESSRRYKAKKRAEREALKVT